MTGKRVGEKGKREKGERDGITLFLFPSSPLPLLPRRRQAGFTLLELMIVISILVILALVAMAQYSKTVLASREATLRYDLYTMRKMIDQYAADKGKLPQSLDELVQAGYIDKIPIDPITDQSDWQVDFGEDPGSTEGAQGVTNIHSASGEVSSDGSTRYSDW